jgi:predicted site-specific integrase-resolvase
MTKLLYTLHEAAEMLSCNYFTLLRMYKAGKLKTVHLTKRALCVPFTELERISGVSSREFQEPVTKVRGKGK